MDAATRIPGRVKFLVYALNFLIWLPVTLVWLLGWPFRFVYRLVLCVIVWSSVAPGRRYIVLVKNGDADPKGHLPQLLGPLGDGAEVLDYQARQTWRQWSLPVRLFWQFGPIPLPPNFTPNYLPAVIVVEKFRWPQTFSFGSLSKNADDKLGQLRAQLKLN